MSLTETIIRTATAPDKPRKLFDGNGLYLLVQPSGSKLWRLKYRVGGVEKLLSLGKYPDVNLKQARDKCHSARQVVASGECPSAQRQAERVATGTSFEAVARDFLTHQAKRLKPVTIADATWRLETFLLPFIGSRPIGDIEAPELLKALQAMQDRPGKPLTDTIHRTKQFAGRVFRYAIAHGLAKRDISQDLRGAIITAQERHHAALTDPRKVGELLHAIDAYQGQPATVYALRLLPLVFLRSSELRNATWSEIDWANGLWRVPAGRMKMNQEHLVPLSRQAVAALTELQYITGHREHLFPGLIPGKTISENTLNQALARIGYPSDVHTPHGFRTTFSTIANELGWEPDLIELQLAHQERNKVRAAYNRAQRIEDRRTMMQRWADHLDSLKGGPA